MEKIDELAKTLIKELKDSMYDIDSNRYGISVSDGMYFNLTGIDLRTLSKVYGETNVYGELRYCKVDSGFQIQYETMVHDISKAELSGAFECDDFLGLFKVEDKMITAKILKDWLSGETEVEGGTLSNVELALKVIREDFAQQWNDYVADEIIGKLEDYDITADDVPYTIKEDIAYTYIETYPNECFEKAVDNLGTYDLKEQLKTIIDNL